MKKLLFYSILFVMGTLIGCTTKTSEHSDKGIELTNLDTTAVPGDDFYKFATAGWQSANPIPDEYSRYGTFDKLRENNQVQVQGLIEELGVEDHKEGTNAQKVGDLYSMGIDSVKLNADGYEPIKPVLAEIDAATSKKDILKLMAQVSKYAASPFFGFYVGADNKNSSMNIAHLYQSGIGMGEREYYLEQDDKSEHLRQEYVKLIKTQFQNIGYSEVEAAKAADAAMKIETELAESHFTKEMRRVPEKNYNKLTYTDLKREITPFDWDYYFEQVGAGKLDTLNVSQLQPIKAAIKQIDKESIENIKSYLTWIVVRSAANYLSDDFVNAHFEFYGKTMSGSKELRPRWRRSIDAVNSSLGEAVGQLYVERYFPAEAKERMLNLVNNVKESLGERISNLDWMSDETKDKAHEKLNTFVVKIGYPDKWKDYSSLEIKDDSYLANIMRASEFEYKEMIDELGKPVDKTKWHMSPQTVNAYYSPSSNEICFPAGILQPPFFYMNADDAVNYGGIGVVIGHEMTHGFDDQGRKFDKEGNLNDWWTTADADSFDERAKVLVDYFDNIVVIDTVRANGTFTLGENIADHGGLQVSYNAYLKTKEAKSNKTIDGFTPQQRFFLSYATLWAGNVRDAEILRLTKIDPHSLGKWRVNGALPHIDAWYDAFNVKKDNAMYLPKEKRASIW
ncbi:MAG: M13 family metallopeptidase [Dysgonamonadaceae bacterium]|nr:M13 family metallopeptidase [Dysgonamonadaceae bacterium]MDD4729424.1 M13 family metallopeptidase [Dysgonamonadaceae bacterium]